VITFRNFSKSYRAQVAVDRLSLDVASGDVVALLGPNGSGKTTSLKAAAGLVRPSHGEVLIGEPPRPSSQPAAREVCSFLPQRVSFPDVLTGIEVVEFYRRLRGAAPGRGREVLKAAALNGASDRLVGTYSGGMVQRLGLAVAMLPNTPILLLDEPTAALDPDGLCTFYGIVERHRDEGRTVLFSSHQLGDVERLADHVAILVGGRLISTFTAHELATRLADRGVMRLQLAGRRDGAVAAVRPVAPQAVWAAGELVVAGPAALRPRVLAALRDAGVEVVSLTAEEGRLDSFYRELLEHTETRQ